MSERDTSLHSKRHRWPWVIAALTLLTGWIVYMLVLYGVNTTRLPDGSSISFLEFVEPKATYSGDPGQLNSYHFELKPKRTAWDSVWKRLPAFLQRHLPVPPSKQGISRSFSCPSKLALWFEVSPTYSDEKWRFFWVDDLGYESETWPFTFNGGVPRSKSLDANWIAFEGQVPGGRKHLHLRIRSREGETVHQPWERRADGKLGEIVAEMKIRNTLQKAGPTLSLTPQTLPAKAACRDHTITLTRVVRSRVASQLTGGLRFEMHLDEGEAVNSRYSLYEWLIEDTKGNIIHWRQSIPSGRAEVVGRALWNDSSVWRARVRALRTLDSDYAPEEKVTFQRIPLPPVAGEATRTEPWQNELMLQGHKIRVHDIESDGSSGVTFQVTVSPRMKDHALMVLRRAGEQGNGGLPDSDHVSTDLPSMEMVALFAGKDFDDIVYRVHLSRPVAGDHLTATFGMDGGVPVEFTFQPEFEP